MSCCVVDGTAPKVRRLGSNRDRATVDCASTITAQTSFLAQSDILLRSAQRMCFSIENIVVQADEARLAED
jgi:hypothetical protein